MTAKEIREAAERLKCRDQDYWFAIDHAPEAAEDAAILSDYILANVQEDGEDVLTDEWLSSIGGELFEYENDFGRCYCFHMDNDVTLNIEVSSRAYFWDVGNDHIVCGLEPVTTRSQFRSLMQGLGIDKPSNP